jgi:alkane 1-monooxygenase
MWKDTKYLLAYVAPLAAYLGIYAGGAWSFGSIYVGFVMIPLLEFFFRGKEDNWSTAEENTKKVSPFFDWLLYLNAPILFGLLGYYFYTLQHASLTNLEYTGMTISVGLIIGTIGINVAHELGHRSKRSEQGLAQLLLMTGLYTHFFIEHNRGHHKNVATQKDPASARKGETLYGFWFRSVIGGYINAWRLERKRLEKLGLPAFHWRNSMIRFQFLHIGYLLTVGFIFGWDVVPFAIGAAIFGFLMLESVNYIEHYGLRRKKLSNGRYEKVSPRHSWNSNHEMGRIFLYELTRHSDHHFKASRKYQVLRHWEESPQLPMGYPAAILLSLVPPLWFWIIHPTLKKETLIHSEAIQLDQDVPL